LKCFRDLELAEAAQPDASPPLRPTRCLVLLYLLYQQPSGLYLGGCQLLSPDHHAAGEPAALLSDDGAPFPEKHGLLDAQDYQRRLVEQGAPEAVSVQYPLSDLRYRDLGTGYNVLLITVDNLNYSRFEKNMPALAEFAQDNVNFTQHMSSGNTADSGMFGLFYGISPSYMDGVLSARIPAALITSLNQQGYQLGLFSSDFSSPLYRQALLSDFSLPAAKAQSDEQTANQWINWLDRYAQDENRWFSWVSLNGTT
jgi:membrane-anchored protein YejM (alkaline phosphatase superfamily)